MGNKKMRVWAGALCALLLVGQQAVRAADEKADEAKVVSLALTTKVGDSVRYKTTLNLDFSGNEIVVEQTRKHVVKEVKENKDLVVVVEEEGGKATVGGSDNEIPASSPKTITLTKDNKVLTFKPEQEDNPYLSTSTQHLMALIDRVILPEKPVKPGDSWTTEVDNPQVKGKKVTIKTTFVKADKVEGAEVWKIKQTLDADTEVADSKLKAEVTAILDATNGQLIEEEQTVKGIPGTNGAIDWKGTIKRVKPETDKEKKS